MFAPALEGLPKISLRGISLAPPSAGCANATPTGVMRVVARSADQSAVRKLDFDMQACSLNSCLAPPLRQARVGRPYKRLPRESQVAGAAKRSSGTLVTERLPADG